jgi:MinD-like ATPase involved in chromosome partitioning or flagellar assembly
VIVTLLVSTGAAWESRALQQFGSHPGTVVLKRCVDVDDLLATASAGQAQVAVLDASPAGLDAGVVAQLADHGVRLVAVAGDPSTAATGAARIGIGAVVAADAIDELVAVVAGGAEPTLPAEPVLPAEPAPSSRSGRGRVIVVHGPGGGPGRTTVAVNLAAEIAARGRATLLVDADPYGGAVAQHLGILDEVSGLLSAARLAVAGSLSERFATVQRQVTDDLRVLTGLPRPDRWSEVRAGTLADVLETAREESDVVVDTGFSLEAAPHADLGSRPERNGLTIEALVEADEVVLVGAADPVGLSRLIRTLTDLHEALPAVRVRVVVNRMRPTLGWRQPEVAAMLAEFGNTAGVGFLPDDQPNLDRAMVEGRSLVEIGDGPLRTGLAGLVDVLLPAAEPISVDPG